MTFVEWTESSVDYTRKLVDSAVEGARAGEGEFVRTEPLGEYLEESARLAVAPAVLGVCLGVLGGLLGNGRRSPGRALVGGLVGGALGFGAGMAWESRELATRVASAAWKNVRKTRDEHWFERNPIDYA
jgi:hypothetical protein